MALHFRQQRRLFRIVEVRIKGRGVVWCLLPHSPVPHRVAVTPPPRRGSWQSPSTAAGQDAVVFLPSSPTLHRGTLSPFFCHRRRRRIGSSFRSHFPPCSPLSPSPPSCVASKQESFACKFRQSAPLRSAPLCSRLRLCRASAFPSFLPGHKPCQNRSAATDGRTRKGRGRRSERASAVFFTTS